jgi:hypothetical protein
MPSLTWYHGEKVLQESARIKMIMKQDKKTYYLCCLEISNVEVCRCTFLHHILNT